MKCFIGIFPFQSMQRSGGCLHCRDILNHIYWKITMYHLFYNHLEEIFNWRWLNSRSIVNIKAKNTVLFTYQFIKVLAVFIILHFKISFIGIYQSNEAYRQNTGSGTQAVPVSQYLVVFIISGWLSFAEDQDLISFVCIWVSGRKKPQNKTWFARAHSRRQKKKIFSTGSPQQKTHRSIMGHDLQGQGAECACLYRYFHLVALIKSMAMYPSVQVREKQLSREEAAC